MNAIHNPHVQSSDVSLGKLIGALSQNADLPLVFQYEGRAVKPGYHVTAVKAGQFSALDCGANPEAWSEIFVQLWDIDEDGRTHMRANTFMAIVRKVPEHVGLDSFSRLTFEVSDGLRPMQLFCAASPEVRQGIMHVDLNARAASCKPRDRWLAEETRKVFVCCGPAASRQNPRCGA